ncbi:MAG: 16S rRNA (adenine(1518)-N(6)/adenine(1519)-N(6))-dimethyltransferase RsmA [Patescibacteria group bacterium]|nr:16S rRNA (adenine(1518)-N(6)/adenine(1519)-N(6))-dimethyltransferase RsmA [Patescibacteria group bacterium]
MTPTQINAALASMGGKANKHLGQHFLIDQSALETIVEAAEIKKGDRVLEVGPGLGVLTRALIDAGANVTAVEKDRRFAAHLSNESDDVQLLMADAAKLNWNELVGDRPWKFVSNLPYAITSLALRKALYEVNPKPKMVVVLVQREVAERVVALRTSHVARPKTSLLSLMVGLVSDDVSIVRRVPAGAFYPPPKVESAILKIVPRPNRPTSYVQTGDYVGRGTSDVRRLFDPEEVMKVAKKGFAHPRKLVQRNLQIENSKWQELSEQIGFNIKARAEDLSVQEWTELAKQVTTGN